MELTKLILGDEAEGIAGFLLWRVSRLWQRRLAIALKDLKLPTTQAVVLANVLRFTEEGREVNQALLAKAATMDRTTTSKALQALERRRLVARAAPEGDLRAYEVRLSARGRAAAFEVIGRFAAAHEAFFKPLGGDEARIAELLKTLMRDNDLS